MHLSFPLSSLQYLPLTHLTIQQNLSSDSQYLPSSITTLNFGLYCDSIPPIHVIFSFLPQLKHINWAYHMKHCIDSLPPLYSNHLVILIIVSLLWMPILFLLLYQQSLFKETNQPFQHLLPPSISSLSLMGNFVGDLASPSFSSHSNHLFSNHFISPYSSSSISKKITNRRIEFILQRITSTTSHLSQRTQNWITILPPGNFWPSSFSHSIDNYY